MSGLTRSIRIALRLTAEALRRRQGCTAQQSKTPLQNSEREKPRLASWRYLIGQPAERQWAVTGGGRGVHGEEVGRKRSYCLAASICQLRLQDKPPNPASQITVPRRGQKRSP